MLKVAVWLQKISVWLCKPWNTISFLEQATGSSLDLQKSSQNPVFKSCRMFLCEALECVSKVCDSSVIIVCESRGVLARFLLTKGFLWCLVTLSCLCEIICSETSLSLQPWALESRNIWACVKQSQGTPETNRISITIYQNIITFILYPANFKQCESMLMGESQNISNNIPLFM